MLLPKILMSALKQMDGYGIIVIGDGINLCAGREKK
jgi:hypothetical protein